MTTDQMIIFALIVLAIGLFILDKWRYDIVALFILFLSVISGVVPANDAFTGFSDPVVVTVACILIISAAISRSGFVDIAIKLLSRFIDKPKLQITLLVTMVISVSAFMNNVGALALFLPVALTFAKKADRKPSELLMPLSFGSLLGGLITLIGTPPNLLISRVREDIVGTPYEMFDFAPVGLCICAVGILYLSWGWRLLPKDRLGRPVPEDRFSIEDYVSEILVSTESAIVGKTVREIETSIEGDFTIFGMVRGSLHRHVISARTVIMSGDVLLVKSDPIDLKKLVDTAKVELVGSEDLENISMTSEEIGIVEAVITADSELIQSTPKQLSLRSRYSVNLLAVRHVGKSGIFNPQKRLSNTKFRQGDVIVLQGNLDAMPVTLAELGCLPLAERNLQLGQPKRAIIPALILLLAVAATVLEIVPISIAFLGGVIAVAVLKLLKLHELYDAIDWPVIMLLGAMIPVTEALRTTGGTELIADAIAAVSLNLSPPAILATVLVSTMLITPFLNNAATVLVMAPIAALLATKLNLNVDPFLMAVAVGASCDFLTPIGHQSNTLVMGPGGYKFGDYARMGLPLSALIVIVGVPVIMFVWPLGG